MNARVQRRLLVIKNKKRIRLIKKLVFYALLLALIVFAVSKQLQNETVRVVASNDSGRTISFGATKPYIAPEAPVYGIASYYSTKDCIGCSRGLVMANGEVLEDTRLSVAYNDAPLNTSIKISNVEKGKSVVAIVTDRGGFNRHQRVIDLSLHVKELLQCGDLCYVKIERY